MPAGGASLYIESFDRPSCFPGVRRLLDNPFPGATDPAQADIAARKDALRIWASRCRKAQARPEEASRRIAERLFALPEFAAASRVMSYVDTRSEVHTGLILETVWQSKKKLFVPWCAPGRAIAPYRIDCREELHPGTFGVLEPTQAVRAAPDRRAAPGDLDLIVVPGLVFDRHGSRIGYGKGYFDNFLREVRPEALVVALAYECQMADCVPTTQHDMPMDLILTESQVYRFD